MAKATTRETKKAQQVEDSGPLPFAEAVAGMFNIVRSNVTLVTLSTADKALRITTYGKPVGDFCVMRVDASPAGCTGFTEAPVVVSFPLLLAACGVLGRGGSKKKAEGLPAVQVALSKTERCIVIKRGRATTSLPLFPYLQTDDQNGTLLDALKEADGAGNKQWLRLPVGRVLEASEALQVNKLKIGDDMANASSRASLVIQSTPSGRNMVAVSSNYSCFIRLLAKDKPLPSAVVISVFAAAMIRSVVSSPEDAESTVAKAHVDGSSVVIVNKRVRSCLLLRLPAGGANGPSSDDILALYQSMMQAINQTPKKARLATLPVGEVKTALIESAMFADVGDGDDPIISLSLGRNADGTSVLHAVANKDARTKAERAVDFDAAAYAVPWKECKSISVSVGALLNLLNGMADGDRLNLCPSDSGSSLLLTQRAVGQSGQASLLRGLAALTARAPTASADDNNLRNED